MKRILKKPSIRILEDKNEKYIYNFGSAELLADGSFFICARQITSLGDPFGRIAAVRYYLDDSKVIPATPPNIRDVQKYPEKGYLMCHVTEMSKNNLIAIYVMIDTDKTKPLFSKANNGMQRAVCRISRSVDSGETWSNGEDLAYTHGDLIIPGKMQMSKDGTIGFPVEMRNVYDEDYVEGIQARFVYSTDGGITFDKMSRIAHDPDVLAGDARCTFDCSDNLVIYFWCFDLNSGFDLDNHRSVSRDSGRTFERIAPVDLHMQITSPMYINDDTIIAIYQERFSDSCG
ncbi:MAG: exo-alpha-sialidase, partial [Clostridia bacterium]|nr:exo-alpha-sialidase [Clostridia bacterium]